MTVRDAFWKVIGLRLGPGLLAGLLALVGVARLIGPALAVDPRGQILFVGERDVRYLTTALSYRGYSYRLSNIEVFRLAPGGSEPVNLTHDPATDHHPTLAPDGCCVIFQSDRNGNWDLYVTDLRGGPAVNLTHRPENDTVPAWSPDGTRIAFIAFDAANNAGLSLLDLTSGQIRQLSPPNHYVVAPPVWAPDGKSIATTTTQFNNGQITTDLLVVQLETGALITLGTHTGMIGNLAWSPDGTHMVYTVIEEGVLYAVWIGQPPLRLTSDDGGGRWEARRYQDFRPVWSPDGSQIAFQADVGFAKTGFDLFVMNADGSAIRNLTHSPGNDANPAWSPDGSQIAFQSWRDGNAEIYVVGTDGRDARRLTDIPGDDWEPVWFPAPELPDLGAS